MIVALYIKKKKKRKAKQKVTAKRYRVIISTFYFLTAFGYQNSFRIVNQHFVHMSKTKRI